MRLGAFELNEPLPELKEPHAIVSLEPWVDVGSVGTLLLSWLEAHFGAKELAQLARPGDYFDFTRYRPTIYYDGDQRRMSIPNAYVTWAQPKTGHGFVFMHLLEPHSHAEEYVESIIRLVDRFRVAKYCLMGSMYDLVPHTRPLLVSGRASDSETQHQLEGMGVGSSTYQGPTSITTLVSQRVPKTGVETLSLIVHLPQYTQMEEDYTGAVRLMEMMGTLYGLPADKGYTEKAEQQLEQINAAVAKNPQLKATLEQLESYYDSRPASDQPRQTPRLSSEVEKFLSEMEKRLRDE